MSPNIEYRPTPEPRPGEDVGGKGVCPRSYGGGRVQELKALCMPLLAVLGLPTSLSLCDVVPLTLF